MPKFHNKNTNNLKDQVSIFGQQPTSSVEMFANENSPHESPDKEFNRTIIKFIKDFTEFKGDTKKHHSEIENFK